MKDRLETKRERLDGALRTAQQRIDQATAEESARKQQQLIAGAGQLLGALFGGRSSTRGLSKIGGAFAGSSAKARAQTAESRAADVQDDLASLEQELADEIAEIQERWDAVAAEVETVPIRLEVSDVKVVDTRLVWIPRG